MAGNEVVGVVEGEAGDVNGGGDEGGVVDLDEAGPLLGDGGERGGWAPSVGPEDGAGGRGEEVSPEGRVVGAAGLGQQGVGGGDKGGGHRGARVDAVTTTTRLQPRRHDALAERGKLRLDIQLLGEAPRAAAGREPAGLRVRHAVDGRFG